MTTIAAAVVLVLGGGLIVLNLRQSNPYPATKWMFDLNTQQLVVGSIEAFAPEDSGGESFDYGELGKAGALVDAYVYTCGDPAAPEGGMTLEELEAVGAKLAFVTRYDNRGAERLRNPSEQNAMVTPVRLFSLPEGKAWFGENSNASMRMQIQEVPVCPDGNSPVLTRP